MSMTEELLVNCSVGLMAIVFLHHTQKKTHLKNCLSLIETKEGFQLSIVTAYRLQKESNEYEFKFEGSGVYRSCTEEGAGLMFNLLVANLLVMVGVFISTMTVLPEPYGSFTCLTMSLVITFIFSALHVRFHYWYAEREVKALIFATPIKVRHLGVFQCNPYTTSDNTRARIREDESLTNSLKRQETTRKEMVENLNLHSKIMWGTNSRKSSEALRWYQNQMWGIDSKLAEAYEYSLRISEARVYDMETRMGYPFFSSELPEGVTQTKPSRLPTVPLPSVERKVISKKVPYHIEVMKDITLNEVLPEQIKERAEHFVREHEEKEKQRAIQAEIDNALLDIRTIERFYDESKMI